MKNIMRRTVAFMLMACLLLSVMAPLGLVKASAEDVRTLTYKLQTFDGQSHNRFSGITSASFDSYYADGIMTAQGSDYWRYLERTDRADLQSGRIQGYNWMNTSWLAIELMNVPSAKYELAFSQAGTQGLELYIIPSAQYTNLATFQASPAGLVGTTTATAGTSSAGTSKFAVELDAYETAGNYVMLIHGTSETAKSTNMYSATLTPIPVYSVVTEYDFNLLDTVLNVPAGGHLNFLGNDEKIGAAIENGVINFVPYAYYAGKFGGSAYIENNYRGQGILHQGGPDGLFAVDIGNPGVGTYTVDMTIPASLSNGTSLCEVYFIPVSDIEAAYEVAVAADETATKGAVIFELIKGGTYTVTATANCYSGTVQAGTAVIDSEEDYAAVFYAKTNRRGKVADELTTSSDSYNKGQMDIVSFTMTRNSYTIADALNGSDSFDTIKMNEDVTASTLNIGTGATLDLNGNALTGTVNVTNGNLVDSVGTGTVSDVAGLQATNKAVVVKDGETYRALSYTAKTNGYKVNTETNAIEFWFDADFAEDAYALLTSTNGVTLNATLEVKGKQVTVDMTQKINDWVAKKGLTDAGENAGLGISVTGFETLKAGDTITVTPVFETETGVAGVFGSAITYTIPET